MVTLIFQIFGIFILLGVIIFIIGVIAGWFF